MNEALAELVALARPVAATAFLIFLRVGAIFAVMPAFGEQMVPARIRLALGIGATALIFPMVQDELVPAMARMPTLQLGLVEVVTGLAFGLALRTFVFMLQTAASMISQSSSLSHIFGASMAEPQPAIGHLLTIAGLCLAVLFDLHIKLVIMLAGSYEVIGPGRGLDADALRTLGLDRIAESFARAFALSAPFLILATLYNIALGVINRAMPQLMVAFVGAPALMAGGLILLAIVAPALIGTWGAGFDAFLMAFGAP